MTKTFTRPAPSQRARTGDRADDRSAPRCESSRPARAHPRGDVTARSLDRASFDTILDDRVGVAVESPDTHGQACRRRLLGAWLRSEADFHELGPLPRRRLLRHAETLSSSFPGDDCDE